MCRADNPQERFRLEGWDLCGIDRRRGLLLREHNRCSATRLGLASSARVRSNPRARRDGALEVCRRSSEVEQSIGTRVTKTIVRTCIDCASSAERSFGSRCAVVQATPMRTSKARDSKRFGRVSRADGERRHLEIQGARLRRSWRQIMNRRKALRLSDILRDCTNGTTHPKIAPPTNAHSIHVLTRLSDACR